MQKSKWGSALIVAPMAIIGLMVGVATMASAQTSGVVPTPAAPVATASSSVSAQAPADTDTQPKHHAPLGGDGIVSSINGTTITMGEETDEGAAAYTVDASKATFSNGGVAATLADIKVGDKIFVEGPATGTTVAATSVSLGHPGGHMDQGNDDAGKDGENPNQ